MMITSRKAILLILLLVLLPSSLNPLIGGDDGVAFYHQGHAANLSNFNREFEVTVDTGISLTGRMIQELERDRERAGRWTFRSQISVWGITARETSIFTNSDNGFIPLFYRLQIPFGDDIDEEFSGRTAGFDRLNVLLQFEQDFASDIETRVWKYKVLNDSKPYSVQFRSHQSLSLPSGAVMRCKVFEVVHGSRQQLLTRFWMDVDTKRLIQIEHTEKGYTYTAIRSDIT